MKTYLLRADNKGDGHQHQAVPHVQHQADLDHRFDQHFPLVLMALCSTVSCFFTQPQ